MSEEPLLSAEEEQLQLQREADQAERNTALVATTLKDPVRLDRPTSRRTSR